MTVTETPVTIETTSLEDLDLGEETLHIKCCRVDRFLCGHHFHPELEATESVPEEEACETCVDIRYHALCPPFLPTHMHCPIPLLGGWICPMD